MITSFFTGVKTCNAWCMFSCMILYKSRLMSKLTKWHVRPAKTQISLGIRLVWSVFAVRMKKAGVLSYPLSAQRSLWSDWADAQANLSSLGAQSFCCFCHEVAQVRFYICESFVNMCTCIKLCFSDFTNVSLLNTCTIFHTKIFSSQTFPCQQMFNIKGCFIVWPMVMI